MEAKVTYSNWKIEELKDLVEIHYNYQSILWKRVAFEFKNTWYTLDWHDIQEIEIKDNDL